MVDPRTIKKRRYILAGLFTLIIFTIGFAIGSEFSDFKLQELEQKQQDLKTHLSTMDLQYTIVSDNICEYVNTNEINQELYDLSSRLQVMEDELGKDNPKVLELVEYYEVLELRHWNLLRKQVQECGIEADLALYFFSNEKGECDKCNEQGYILTYLKNKYPNFVGYAFNIHIDNPVLNMVKNRYNITSTPSLVINEETYPKFMSTDEIEAIITDREVVSTVET
ncbi:hypothetical protein CL622_01235 [archaeon]|nr:hypothetical protein [archaeon]